MLAVSPFRGTNEDEIKGQQGGEMGAFSSIIVGGDDDDDGFGRYIAVADVAGVVVDADAVVEVSSESVQFARPRNIFVSSKKKPYASGSSS